VHFVEEWPVEEVRLKRLERYAREGHMTEGQLALRRAKEDRSQKPSHHPQAPEQLGMLTAP
jgi:hypothetical protein